MNKLSTEQREAVREYVILLDLQEFKEGQEYIDLQAEIIELAIKLGLREEKLGMNDE